MGLGLVFGAGFGAGLAGGFGAGFGVTCAAGLGATVRGLTGAGLAAAALGFAAGFVLTAALDRAVIALATFPPADFRAFAAFGPNCDLVMTLAFRSCNCVSSGRLDALTFFGTLADGVTGVVVTLGVLAVVDVGSALSAVAIAPSAVASPPPPLAAPVPVVPVPPPPSPPPV